METPIGPDSVAQPRTMVDPDHPYGENPPLCSCEIPPHDLWMFQARNIIVAGIFRHELSYCRLRDPKYTN